MKMNIMKKDESFIGIWENYIILRNKRGEARLVMMTNDEYGVHVVPNSEILITYGNGNVSIGDMDSGIEITNF